MSANSRFLPLANSLASSIPTTRMNGMRTKAFRVAGVYVQSGTAINAGVKCFGPQIYIGNSWIGMGTWLISTEHSGIYIGDDCDLGPQVLITVGSHKIGPGSRRAGPGTSSDVVVHDGCWIGARSVILSGVTVGEGSIVAAGAVVVSDVAAGSLVAGVPARLVKNLPLEGEAR